MSAGLDAGLSAVSITTLGLSTWQAMTSAPAATSELVASASRTGIDQSPVITSCTTAFGLTRRTPSVKVLMLRRTIAMGLAATKPILFVFVDRPAAMPLM